MVEIMEDNDTRLKKGLPTFNIQMHVDVRKVAIVLMALDEEGMVVRSLSGMGRACLNAVSKKYAHLEPEMSVSLAMGILEKHGLSTEQLRRGGMEIRRAIAQEEEGLQAFSGEDKGKVKERAEEALKVMEGDEEDVHTNMSRE